MFSNVLPVSIEVFKSFLTKRIFAVINFPYANESGGDLIKI